MHIVLIGLLIIVCVLFLNGGSFATIFLISFLALFVLLSCCTLFVKLDNSNKIKAAPYIEEETERKNEAETGQHITHHHETDNAPPLSWYDEFLQDQAEERKEMRRRRAHR